VVVTDRSAGVVLTHPGAELYGSDRMAVESVRALAEAGNLVTVVLPESGPLVELLEQAGATVVFMSVPVLRKSLISPRGLGTLAWTSARGLIRALRLIRRLRPQAVYINTLTQPVWVVASWMSRVSSLVHVREAELGGNRHVQRVLHAPLGLVTRVIANSESTKRHVVDSTPTVLGDIRVIYNGKAWDGYYRSDLSMEDGALTVGFVGRLSPRKGVHVLVAACGLLLERGMRVRLVIAGSVYTGYEWYEAELRDAVEKSGLGGLVEFVGFVENAGEVFSGADIAVVPSLVEPFGTVAAEALASKRPVIASRVDGLQEIVTHEKTGLLVEPGQADQLADAIERLVRDRTLASDLASAGFEDVRDRFSLTQYARATQDVVAELRQGRPGRHG
jgi:glycosyltransferase involved in cell wall biosynthesis